MQKSNEKNISHLYFFLNFHEVKNNFFFINNDIYYSYIREYIKILKRNILCSNYCVNKYYTNTFHIYMYSNTIIGFIS